MDGFPEFVRRAFGNDGNGVGFFVGLLPTTRERDKGQGQPEMNH
jgi:hypothetical protein